MESVYKLAQIKKAGLFLPESFEWLVLSSGVVKGKDVAEILSHPADFIESHDYFSWESFFTQELIEKTAGTYLEYHKRSLNSNYLKDHEFHAIASQLEASGLPAISS